MYIRLDTISIIGEDRGKYIKRQGEAVMQPSVNPEGQNRTDELSVNPDVSPTSKDVSSTTPPPVDASQLAGHPLSTRPEYAQSSKKSKMWIVFTILTLLILLAIGGYYYYTMTTKPVEKTPVKVGVLAAFTSSGTIGFDSLKAVQLAKKTLKADEVTLVRADSQCDGEKAKRAFEQLANQGVVAIIGDSCSNASLQALKGANVKKIPMISPTASSPTLTIANDYFFRVIPSDNYQAPYIAKAMHNKGIKRVAVVYSNESYGTNLSQKFEEAYKKLGGTVAVSVGTDPSVLDYGKAAADIKAAKVDGVFFVINASVSATAAIKTIRAAGVTAPFYGSDAYGDTSIMADAGDAAEGFVYTSFADGTKEFDQMMFAEYRTTETLYGAAQAYDAFHAIYRTLQGGAKTGEEIKNALPSLNFTGVSGTIKFDGNGEVLGDTYRYDLKKYTGGKIVDEQ